MFTSNHKRIPNLVNNGENIYVIKNYCSNCSVETKRKSLEAVNDPLVIN